MILGTGVDIAAVKRFEKRDELFLRRILSPDDMLYVNRFREKAQHIAGFWAAKEALVKATGKKDIVFNEVSILHSVDGAPSYSFRPEKGQVHLSISHEADYAVAFAVWEE